MLSYKYTNVHFTPWDGSLSAVTNTVHAERESRMHFTKHNRHCSYSREWGWAFIFERALLKRAWNRPPWAQWQGAVCIQLQWITGDQNCSALHLVRKKKHEGELPKGRARHCGIITARTIALFWLCVTSSATAASECNHNSNHRQCRVWNTSSSEKGWEGAHQHLLHNWL